MYLLDEASQLVDGRQRALERWVWSCFSVSSQQVDDACETGEHLPLRWRQLAYLLAQSIVALLEEGDQERIILGVQQATKTRVEISSLISEEIHVTGAFHTQSRCQPNSASSTEKEEREKSLRPSRLDGVHTLYVQIRGHLLPADWAKIEVHDLPMGLLGTWDPIFSSLFSPRTRFFHAIL